MKSDSLLLIVGVLGIVICGYGIFSLKDTTTSLIGFICGASLIWAYFELKKARQKN